MVAKQIEGSNEKLIVSIYIITLLKASIIPNATAEIPGFI